MILSVKFPKLAAEEIILRNLLHQWPNGLVYVPGCYDNSRFTGIGSFQSSGALLTS